MTATSFHWTSADGLALHAHDHAAGGVGDRGAVICLHGLTRNGRDFEDLAPRIAATGRRVLAADVRGRGQSDRDPNPANYNPLIYAGDVISLMAAAGLPGAIFIGKTNTPEWGHGSHSFNPVFGVTRNPYDLSRTAGGSSGGICAFTAACRARSFLGSMSKRRVSGRPHFATPWEKRTDFMAAWGIALSPWKVLHNFMHLLS